MKKLVLSLICVLALGACEEKNNSNAINGGGDNH